MPGFCIPQILFFIPTMIKEMELVFNEFQQHANLPGFCILYFIESILLLLLSQKVE